MFDYEQLHNAKSVRENNTFIYVNNENNDLPEWGWKIHVSATLLEYKNVFDSVIPFLIKQNISFKFIKSEILFRENISKQADSGISGKYITVYPVSTSDFVWLLSQLDNLTQQTNGIYVYSDAQYNNNSNLYYRFGQMQLRENSSLIYWNKDHTKSWIDGDRPYFELPSWISIPTMIETTSPSATSYLNEHYKITSLISRNNGGNRYKGIKLSDGKEVLLKESKPFILEIPTSDITVSSLRKNEYEIAKLLSTTASGESAVDSFSEWINDYYVYEFVSGISLDEFVAKPNSGLFMNDALDIHQNTSTLNHLIQIMKNIFDVVQMAHAKNIILNDIHPSNFIVKSDDSVKFIDYELSFKTSDLSHISAGTPGYYLSSWPHDLWVQDFRKVGMLFLFLLGGTNKLITEYFDTAYAISTTTKLLHAKGLTVVGLSELLNYLLLGSDLNDATVRSMLETLNVQNNVPSDIFEPINTLLMQVITTNESLVNGIPFVDSTALNQWFNSRSSKIEVQIVQGVNHQITTLNENWIQNITLGIQGISGLILLLQQFKPSTELVNAKKQLISLLLDSIEKSPFGLSAPVYANGIKYYSPYLIDGNMGIIVALLSENSDNYDMLIDELLDVSKNEFTKQPTYLNGLMGIAHVCFEVAIKKNDAQLLSRAHRMWQLVQIYIKKGPNESINIPSIKFSSTNTDTFKALNIKMYELLDRKLR